MIIAKTIKGKGISFLEDKNGWHGKALNKEELSMALNELKEIDTTIRGEISKPEDLTPLRQVKQKIKEIDYPEKRKVATRKAYGMALARIYPQFPNIVVLDAEVSNSTFAEIFKNAYPERFFEMFYRRTKYGRRGIGSQLSR